MQENKKSKKERLEKLRMLLDDPSKKDLHPEDEKYLTSLSKRLDSSKERVAYVHKQHKDETGEVDPLKPQVVIHERERVKTPVIPELKEFKEVEEEIKPEKEIESLQKDEDLYEVEKVEVEGPEFVEVTPKETKEEVEEEKAPEETPETIKDEKLPEWEPIEVEKTKDKKAELTEIEEVKEETKPDATAAPVELLTESSKWEPIKDDEIKEEKPVEEKEISEPEMDRDSKIRIFKDIESIDWEMAILLYDNGITSIDVLKDASLKDLTKIRGVKKKLAKNIKKELEEKEKEPLPIEEEGFQEIEQEPASVEEDKLPIDEKEADQEEYFIVEGKTEDDAEKVEEEISKYEFEDDKRLDVFKEIKSIDDKIAVLLYDNGIISIDALREKTIKELTKIKGIRKKVAKEIKTELNEMDERADVDDSAIEKDVLTGESSIQSTDEEEWEAYDEHETPDEELKEIKAHRHGEYTLYEKKIELGSGKKRTVRFFSKGEPEDSEPIELPDDFEVKVNKKTGVPYLKKKK